MNPTCREITIAVALAVMALAIVVPYVWVVAS